MTDNKVETKVFKSTITFLEPHKVTGFIRATNAEDARAQLEDAAKQENLISFGIESLDEVDTSQIIYPPATVIPMEEDEQDDATPSAPKPVLN